MAEQTALMFSWEGCKTWYYNTDLTFTEAQEFCISRDGRMSIIDDEVLEGVPSLGDLRFGELGAVVDVCICV